ncbi:MAG: hypothetical protein JSU96_07770 [Acidobacteriota bacterium]|nr:MAG: hypothetical protein JSU96_07770 [Acidobacteriota bacterium]
MIEKTWTVEIWAENEDFRLRRDDRARERVRVTQVTAPTAEEAKQMVLQNSEVSRRWPRANASAYRVRT